MNRELRIRIKFRMCVLNEEIGECETLNDFAIRENDAQYGMCVVALDISKN